MVFKNKLLADQYDAVIGCDHKPVSVIGLLSIEDRRAEYYITLGEQEYKGKGVAKEATRLLLHSAFTELGLSEVYLYTDIDNTGAQMLFERYGFKEIDLLKGSVFNRGVPVDRFYYAITAEEFMKYNELDIINGGIKLQRIILCNNQYSRWAA